MRRSTRLRSWRLAALAAPAVLVAVLVLAATGSAKVGAAGSPLVVNISVAPSTLDPASTCGLYDRVQDNTYVRLTQYGRAPAPDGTTQFDPSHIVPYFAKSWTISKNGLVYTFTLRAGAKFPSGQPVDAAAFKWSLERTIAMNGCGTYFVYDGLYTPPLIKAIVARNPTTLVITLSQADANFLQDMAQSSAAVVDRSLIEAHGGVQKNKINTWMSSHTAGSGPFMMTEYEPNKRMVLEASPTYYGKQPASKKIIVNFINSDPTLLLQARSGAADVTLGLSKQSAVSLQKSKDVNVPAYEISMSEQIGLPNDKPPLNNVKLREALTYAVPYDQILSKVAFGYGKLFYGAYFPKMSEFNAALEKPRKFDLAKAQALVKASGVQTPISLQMVVQEGNTIDEQIATIVQGVWRQLGVDVDVQKLSPSDYINSLEQHKAQSYVRLDGPGVVEAGYFLGYDMKCKIGFNLTAMCIPKADKLAEQARKTIDKAKRQKLWDQINKLWIADSPKIHVYEEKYVVGLNKRVKGFFFMHYVAADMSTWSK
jgi:peptide/nickel transport system substrate-binding protein